MFLASLAKQKKLGEKEKKKELSLPSIFPVNRRRPGAFTSGEEKNRCERRTKEKAKCQRWKKKRCFN